MTVYSDALWYRACYRVAGLVRSLCEEKGSSDTRLFDHFLLPNDLAIVGRTVMIADTYHREHVVPRSIIARECHLMLKAGADDHELAKYISTHTAIVIISREEQQRLDRSAQLGLRTRMPEGWYKGTNIFARLDAAGISWTSIEHNGFKHPALSWKDSVGS